MTDAIHAAITIPPTTMTADSAPVQTQSPFPKNPYQDIISPAEFAELLEGVVELLEGVVELIPNLLEDLFD